MNVTPWNPFVPRHVKQEAAAVPTAEASRTHVMSQEHSIGTLVLLYLFYSQRVMGHWLHSTDPEAAIYMAYDGQGQFFHVFQVSQVRCDTARFMQHHNTKITLQGGDVSNSESQNHTLSLNCATHFD